MPSDLIFWEFVRSLFGFFVLLSIVTGLVCGYILGYRQFGIVALIVACPVIWFFQALLVFGFDTNIQSLSFISSTGVQQGIDWVFSAHLILHPSLVVLAIIFGQMKFAGEVHLIRQLGLNLTANEVLRMLNVLSNHPELASAGWFATRWAEMSDDERATWVNHKLRNLRLLWMLGFDYDEEGGFEGFGVALPMKLAAIDNGENVE